MSKTEDDWDDDAEIEKTRQQIAHLYALYQQDPQNPALIRDISDLHVDLGEIQEAKTLLTRAITERIAVKELTFHLGVVCLSIGEVEEAIALFERLWHAGLDVPELFYNLAYGYLMQHKTQEVINLLQPISHQFTQLPELAMLLSRALYWEGALDTALSQAAWCHQELPEQADPLGLLAMLSLENEEHAAAYHWAQAALKKEASQIDALNALTGVMFRRGEFPQAMHYCHLALKTCPNHPRVYLGLGLLALQTLQAADAQFYFEGAIHTDPYHVGLYIGLVWSYMLQGDWEEAWNILQEAHVLDPNDPIREYHNRLLEWMRKNTQSPPSCHTEAHLPPMAHFAHKVLEAAQATCPVTASEKKKGDAFLQAVHQIADTHLFQQFLADAFKRHGTLKSHYH